jgi:RNA polymerase primary sigma factor
METYTLPTIASLADQLRRGPRRLRLRQLLNIEFLLSVIEYGKQYPYDFICHALTGYRPATTTDGDRLLDGEPLIADLVELAEDLSGDADLTPEGWAGVAYSVNDLARRFDVSTKTIFRWRRRGLAGWRFRCADRRQRLFFPEHAVRRFVGNHVDLVARGSTFSQLSPQERERIVARAQALTADGPRTVNAVARTIATEVGRAIETVRLILKHHDEAHPSAGIFNRSPLHVQGHDQHLAIWEAYVDGARVEALAERFGRSVAWVYRVVTEMRARELRNRKIEYVFSDEFTQADADTLILHTPPTAPLRQPLTKVARRVPAGLPPYLAQLFEIPLLTRAGEAHFFRRMNYLKYKADELRAAIDPEAAHADQLDQIDELLAAAAAVKNQLVQANLRLVVGIAKRHVTRGNELFELISDGNISLMRAVDKFDYMRGFKFSTYATWAVMKNFARSVPEQHHHRERYQTGWDELLSTAAAAPLEEGETSRLALVRGTLDRMLGTLDVRERAILRQRYGLDERGEPQTLEQIGQRFGVSKERIRQLEARAISKLRVDFQVDVERLLGS